jgi:hypothetical protein
LITALLALLSQLKSTPGKPDGLFHTAVEQTDLTHPGEHK